MTCYCSHVFPDRIELICDTAAWDSQTLNLTSILQKVMPVGSFPLVVTGRGAIGHLAYVAVELSRHVHEVGVDAGIARFGLWLYDLQGIEFLPGSDLLIAGWCEARGFFHLRAELDGDRALDPIRSDFFAGTTLTGRDFRDSGFDYGKMASDFRGEGVRLLQAARAQQLELEGRPVVPCGGTVMLATITKGGVGFETLGGWPDLLGQPMNREAAWRAAADEEDNGLPHDDGSTHDDGTGYDQ